MMPPPTPREVESLERAHVNAVIPYQAYLVEGRGGLGSPASSLSCQHEEYGKCGKRKVQMKGRMHLSGSIPLLILVSRSKYLFW